MLRAILVCVDKDLEKANRSLDELSALVKTLDIKEVARVTQRANFFNHKTYVGEGKLEEIKQLEIIEKVDYVIFDDELTPAQMFNLDEILVSSVLDRAYVILDIFRKRATTDEARLEIKLANLKYLYPRIRTFHEGFDRQGGMIGSKGSGETQLELDQRAIVNEIVDTKNKIEALNKRKQNEIIKRKNSQLKTIALVGYTNAGKSTTLNTLLTYLNKHEYKSNTKSKTIEAEDKLFKTLSTSVRRLTYKNIPFLLTDTIGFISKIPANLINSFLTTLEETKNADLIIVVVDSTDKDVKKQIETTVTTLYNILDKEPRILFLMNKVDNLDPNITISLNFDFLLYSNKEEKYQFELLEYIKNFLLEDYEILDLEIPYTDYYINSLIESKTSIISKTYLDTYTLYKVYAPKTLQKELSLYQINTNVS